MKQQILNLKKKLLIVELPEKINGEDVSINHSQDDYDQLEFQYPTHDFRGLQCYDNILLPKGNNHKPVGKLTDITEEQFKEWVEQYMIDRWRNYLTESQYIEYLKSTAKESFFSYLEAQGVYFENPFGKIEPELSEDDLWGDMAQDSQVYAGILYKKDKWQEAEQKVWSKDRCYIFEII